MDPALITLVVLGTPAIILTFISDKLRSILRAVFRRPRETSVIITRPDGARLELRGPLPSEDQLAVLLNSLKKPESQRQDDAEAVAGGESDE